MAQGQIFTKLQYTAEAVGYGTEGVSYAVLPRVQRASLDSDNQFIYDRGLGEGLNAKNTYYGPFVGSGNVSFEVTGFDFLRHFIGHRTGAGTVSSKYTLTEATSIQAATAGAGILQPFSVELANDDKATTTQFATGCVGLDFSLTGSIGSKLTCDANFVAQKTGYRATAQSYTASTDPAFIMINGSFKWGSSPTAVPGVQSFTINYTNGINPESNRDMTSRFIGIPVFGQREYKFTVSIIMASTLSTTIINDFYGTNNAGVYTPNTGTSAISPANNLQLVFDLVNGSNYATIQLDKCSIDRLSIPRQLGEGVVLLSIEGTAREGKDNAPIQWWAA